MTSPFLTPEDIRKDKVRFTELQKNYAKLQENLAKLQKLEDKKRSQSLLHRVRDYKSRSHSAFFELDSDNPHN